MRTLVVAALLATIALPASARLACHEEEGTRKRMCYDDGWVFSNGDVRSSELYTGGPKEVRPTGVSLVVHCKAQLILARGSDGVNLGAASSSSTAESRALSRWICAEKKTRKDPKLTIP